MRGLRQLVLGRCGEVSGMNTRRVPGVTRNSGWQAVDAEIVRARALVQHQDGAAPVADWGTRSPHLPSPSPFLPAPGTGAV